MTGREIQALRHKLGESTTQFAARLYCSPRTVEDWEQGRRLKAKMSAEAQHTERATARLAKLYCQHDTSDSVQEQAVRALRQADAAGRAWSWARATKALARAYRALGAPPPIGATGYDWHRGAHPLQVAMRQLAATAAAAERQREVRR